MVYPAGRHPFPGTWLTKETRGPSIEWLAIDPDLQFIKFGTEMGSSLIFLFWNNKIFWTKLIYFYCFCMLKLWKMQIVTRKNWHFWHLLIFTIFRQCWRQFCNYCDVLKLFWKLENYNLSFTSLLLNNWIPLYSVTICGS